ncbi:MAG: 4-hydroxythreonine-4-phosphate dehydrogenase PdxA [Magnetococcales bacterium]|nr:4-hydroxythreonine-4-phosphate dehydrogenase PdxA [Magnetococcales bacterium]
MAAGSSPTRFCGISLIAVTMGDPAGIGPELALRGFSPVPRRVYVGDPEVFRMTARHLNLDCPIREVESPEMVVGVLASCFCVIPVEETVPFENIVFGLPDPRFAAATVNSILACCRLAQAGRVDAMVTLPINKGVMHTAGYTFPGHTELIGSFAEVAQPVMMLTGKGLRVVPVTIHQSLASVSSTLTQERLHRVIVTTWEALVQDFGISSPRVTVAGLNPHAGEGGIFGQEEGEIIAPVCAALRGVYGPGLVGPLPADTLFHDRMRSTYDAVVLMYHDQALIPIKMLAFGEAVNCTLGLPFIRTSVDHGTAYDIAGQGVADCRSFHHALALAEEMGRNRKK